MALAICEARERVGLTFVPKRERRACPSKSKREGENSCTLKKRLKEGSKVLFRVTNGLKMGVSW